MSNEGLSRFNFLVRAATDLDRVKCLVNSINGSNLDGFVKSNTLSNFPLTETIVSDAGLVNASYRGVSWDC